MGSQKNGMKKIGLCVRNSLEEEKLMEEIQEIAMKIMKQLSRSKTDRWCVNKWELYDIKSFKVEYAVMFRFERSLVIGQLEGV